MQCTAYTLLHILHEIPVGVSRLCHWGAAGSHCLISMQGRHIYYIWCIHTASLHALLRMYTAIAMHWAASGGHWLACRIAEQAHILYAFVHLLHHLNTLLNVPHLLRTYCKPACSPAYTAIAMHWGAAGCHWFLMQAVPRLFCAMEAPLLLAHCHISPIFNLHLHLASRLKQNQTFFLALTQNYRVVFLVRLGESTLT